MTGDNHGKTSFIKKSAFGRRTAAAALCLFAAAVLLLMACRGGGGGVTPLPGRVTEMPDIHKIKGAEGNVSLGIVPSLVPESEKGVVPNADSAHALTDGDREQGTVIAFKDAAGILIELPEYTGIGRIDIYPAVAEGVQDGKYPHKIVIYTYAGETRTFAAEYRNDDLPDIVPVIEFEPRGATAVLVVVYPDGLETDENGFSICSLGEIETVSIYGDYPYPDGVGPAAEISAD